MLPIFLLLSFISINVYTIQKKSHVKSQEVSLACDFQGYPKKSALKSLVAAQLLNDSDKISIKKIQGGYYSEKMYVVMSKKDGKKIPLYFFKISKKYKSTENLIKIQEGPIGQKIRDFIESNENCPPISRKNLPNIIWLETIFTYRNNFGSKKTIEVTPSAQGQLLQDILDSHDLEMIKTAAYSIGKSLAAFHQLFMDYKDSQEANEWRTIYHGDFSIRNTLFDPVTSKVYFIDNEGMNRGSISQDVNAILTSFVMFKYLKQNFAHRWPLYVEYCLSFLKGYIQSYPTDKRASLAIFIEETLKKSFDKSLYRRIINDKGLAGKEFNEKDFRKIIYNYLHKFNKN